MFLCYPRSNKKVKIMIRITPINLGINKTGFNPKQNPNKQYKSATNADSFVCQDSITFGARPPQKRFIKKFLPSLNFIKNKKLTLSAKKTLAGGEKVETRFEYGKKIYEIQKTNNLTSTKFYDDNEQLITTHNSHYLENQLIKKELIKPNGDSVTKTYFEKKRRTKSVVKGNETTKYNYDSKEKLTDIVITDIDAFGAKTKAKFTPDMIPISFTKTEKDGAYTYVEYIDGKKSKFINITDPQKENQCTTEMLFKNDKKTEIRIIELSGTEYVENYDENTEKLIKTTLIRQTDNGTIQRDEIFYNKSEMPDNGMIFVDGDITYFTKYDSDGEICDKRDVEGYVVPFKKTKKKFVFEPEKLFKPQNNSDWVKMRTIHDIIPNSVEYFKFNSN